MICRIWRGWTTPELADTYQAILTGEVMPAIHARAIAGFKRHEAMRRDIDGPDGSREVEFTTIMWFSDIQAIQNFVGEDFETAHVPDKPRAVLKRFDARSVHYTVVDQARAPQLAEGNIL